MGVNFKTLHSSLRERRLEDLDVIMAAIGQHVDDLSSRIYLGTFEYKVDDVDSLPKDVKEIVIGVRDGTVEQPQRAVPYVPREEEKDLGLYPEIDKLFDRREKQIAEYVEETGATDIFYPELGIFLGVVNVNSRVIDNEFCSNSFSSDQQNNEIYFMPKTNSFMSFLMKNHYDNMGPMGLGSHYNVCLKIAPTDTNIIINNIDLLVLASRVEGYLSSDDKKRAHTSFKEFYEPSGLDNTTEPSPAKKNVAKLNFL